MLEIVTLNKFKKEFNNMIKRGKDISKLVFIMQLLAEEKPLGPKHDNHKLKGNYVGHWECKVEPDWLLIYTKNPTHIIFTRTGTHADLFE